MDELEIFKAQKPESGNFDFAFEIEGKKLYFHKSVVSAASETLNSMLSERWNKNATTIEIINPYHSFDRFYEFLSFIYSRTCNLTDENVFALTDMAEFYGIQTLKNRCVQYLLKMDVVISEIEELLQFAQKYSLMEYDRHLKRYMRDKFLKIIRSDKFLKCKKSVVDFISIFKPNDTVEDAFFFAIYKWAEHQVSIKRKECKGQRLDFAELLKAELKNVISNVEFSKISFTYVKEFILKNRALFSLFSTSELYEIISSCKKFKGVEEDECFKILYEMAKSEVIKKQEILPGDNINLNHAIKDELIDVLPNINFHQMSLKFLMDFIIEKDIYFSFFDLYEFLTNNSCNKMNESDIFEAVYRLAEKQVLWRQETSPDPHFNLFVSIKMRLIGVLPIVKFYKMDSDFLFNFVVKKGFSLALLSKSFENHEYCKNVNPTFTVGTDHVEIEVFKFAVYCGFQSLIETCRLYFEEYVNPTNVCEFVKIAYENNFEELKQKCLKILFKNRTEIDASKIADLPKNILSDAFDQEVKNSKKGLENLKIS